MRLNLPILATLLASTALNGSAAPTDTDRDIRFREKVDVERVIIDARAVDGRGQPILGLAATNFQVKVDGKPVALESATWVTGTPPDESFPAVQGDAAAAAPEGDVVVGGLPRGRLIVMLFQKDFDPSRLTGLLRMQSKAVKFLDTLGPEDRVAVLTFDYHLKLWQDFTGDRDRLRLAIQRSLFFGKFPSGQSVDPPSLAEGFDF